MLPTLADVLELDTVRRGRPQVLAGHQRLGTPVRWVQNALSFVGFVLAACGGGENRSAKRREHPGFLRHMGPSDLAGR